MTGSFISVISSGTAVSVTSEAAGVSVGTGVSSATTLPTGRLLKSINPAKMIDNTLFFI